MTTANTNCPLCDSKNTKLFHEDKKRPYQKCETCDLIYVPASHHLDSEQEKAVYDQHENNPQDSGYRKFLSRAWLPLREQLKKGSSGLDFGSGPGPTLSLMAQEDGFPCAIYDLYFANDPTVLLENGYDFIISTEVIEHLASPIQVLRQLFSMLKAGGLLCLMTKRHHPSLDFSRWHYILDPTHITFFSEQTFLWIAKEFNCQLQVADKDVVILEKLT